jgi:hypothetical protein
MENIISQKHIRIYEKNPPQISLKRALKRLSPDVITHYSQQVVFCQG